MSKVDLYRETLKTLENWDEFLLQESGLPGRRGNIELAQAVAEEGGAETYMRYLTFNSDQAPTNSPYEFLAFCGVVGLGRLAAEGDLALLEILRQHASDPRWRIREAVAMALQRLGRKDMDVLLQEMERWSTGNPLEKRAAAAGLCEPELLRDRDHAQTTLRILDRVTASIEGMENRRSDGFKALRKGLGYCWSVAVAAAPQQGKSLMQKWFSSDDRDILWIMRENLRKRRLSRMDFAWVENWKVQLGMTPQTN
jgi:hypothetical protein